MPLPQFAATTPTRSRQNLSRNEAAQRMGISRNNFDKLIDAGLVAEPLAETVIDDLAGRAHLVAIAGELTVLRTAARDAAYDEDRVWIGFHLGHTDTELTETSLRWWRADPDRIINNQLYAVTIATIPVAAYRITEVTGQRPDGTKTRYHFAGELLARLTADHNDTPTIDYRITADHGLYQHVKQIMTSRITVNSGGPIGYLTAD